MAELATTPCLACKAPIVFALLPSGKRMPLDAEPASDGHWVVVDGFAAVATKYPEHQGPRFTAHWGTCSDAKRFRKPKTTKGT